ncbi:MAG: protein kinase [Actinomycetota bacterium]
MPGRRIADRYELESKLGSGGMGTVWKANDRLLARTVALKLLRDDLPSDEDFEERFRREARLAASLTHPNVAIVHDTGEVRADGAPDGVSPGTPFIVMEYVDGESLHEMIKRQGPLPIDDVARIARSILAALAHAHERGLIHRDVKPANILLDSRTGAVKVVDFGIAKGLDDRGVVTATSSLIGTASYMSPEQVNGQHATEASDLYAVGCLLYCCLAGEPPFGGTTAVTIAMHHLNDPVPPLRTRRPDVPASFEAIVMRALEKDPTRRFASAQAMDQATATMDLDSGVSTEHWTVESGAEPIRVLLVDDHVLVTQALSAVIDGEPDIEVVGCADTAEQGKALAKSLTPDVVLMDYELPDGDGVSAARGILAERPQTQIVMLTGATSDLVLMAAIEAGCAGFVPKEQAVEEVVAAVRSAHAGEAPISPQLLARLLPKLREGKRPVGFDLTQRETQILGMLAEGLTNQAIADKLAVAIATVRKHVQHVITKIGAHSKLEAVAIATREGLVDPKRTPPG